ncbi:MAG: exodeoxyribonuclease VII large subunit, partial [Bacteroidetes bacterium]|nr:exodeoxyribonuclease VII large subunit [Bacteroidota bacterium]
MPDPAQKIFTLSSVAKAITNTLAPVTSRRFWVQAEVTQPKEVGGHMYATLVEVADGRQVAKLNCVIWRDSLASIRRKFKKEELTFEFTNGARVCLLCSVSFHATGGLKLAVYDADTSFQLGEMERRRREIIQRLEAEKLHERNRILSVPMLPRRIGLITGKDSAAMNDILRTLRDGGHGITLYVAEALMQGDKCEASILRAFDVMQRLGVDVIAIARGGGGKSELAALDNESIARRIAGSAIPVWTAIGHETDISVLDFVAHTFFKTPTALAEDIVRRYREQEIVVQRALDRFRREWKHRLEKDYRSFSDNVTGIRQGSRKLHDLALSELQGSAEHLRSHVRSRFAEERSAIAVFTASLRNVSKRVLDARQQVLQGAGRSVTAAGRRSIGQAAEALGRNRGRLSEERVARLLAAES